jgi:hypothetical protein
MFSLTALLLSPGTRGTSQPSLNVQAIDKHKHSQSSQIMYSENSVNILAHVNTLVHDGGI